MSRLEGKVAVVSGAASGIGRAIAERFVAEGATVIGGDIQEADVPFTLRRLDVRREEDWISLIDAAEQAGGPDILLNVAGTTGWKGIHELDVEEWDRIVSINQTGTYLGMKHAIGSMLKRERPGSVVNISSMFSLNAVPNLAAYHASKAAVIGLTRNAAVTYARQGVRVNAIQPGWIATPMTASQEDSMNQSFIDNTPIGKGGSPEDIASGALYLASDEAAFVTGAVLPIDGGYLAQ